MLPSRPETYPWAPGFRKEAYAHPADWYFMPSGVFATETPNAPSQISSSPLDPMGHDVLLWVNHLVCVAPDGVPLQTASEWQFSSAAEDRHAKIAACAWTRSWMGCVGSDARTLTTADAFRVASFDASSADLCFPRLGRGCAEAPFLDARRTSARYGPMQMMRSSSRRPRPKATAKDLTSSAAASAWDRACADGATDSKGTEGRRPTTSPPPCARPRAPCRRA